nr:MogA/MoaB family molybdenum cofactor biosynthesis protein [Mesoaciditoga lauensis]
MLIKIAILTISDKGSRGERKDTSSLVIREMVKKIGEVIAYDLVPDEKDMIIERLKYFCDDLKVDLVLTTGGTGFSPRDVTPEATKAVIEKEVPGIPEAMRIFSFKKSPLSVLSREIAGIRKGTLIVNLPGSPKGVRENLEVVVDQLVHGIKILRGEKLDLAKEE